MVTPIKYPVAQEGDSVLLRLCEDYEQAVLDLFDADQEAKEVRLALEVVGHTSNFLSFLTPPGFFDLRAVKKVGIVVRGEDEDGPAGIDTSCPPGRDAGWG